MLVQGRAEDAKNRERHPFENAVLEALYVHGFADKRIFSKVVLVTVDLGFCGIPTSFELQKSLIVRFRSAEAEIAAASPEALPDRLPHDQVVGPYMLILLVGGPELINGRFTEMEVDPACDTQVAQEGKGGKPISRCD